MTSTNTNGKNNGNDICHKLLDAAERLFAEKGFEAASVRDITQEAGCNLAAVNYHFGSKENLYRQVFIRQYGGLRDHRLSGIQAYMETAAESLTLEGLIRAFAGTFVCVFSVDQNEEEADLAERCSQLLSRQMLDLRIEPELFLQEVLAPVRAVFIEAIKKVCPGLSEQKAFMCMTSIVGQMLHLHLMQKMFSRVDDKNIDKIPIHFRNFEIAVDHIVAFSAAGIRHILQEQQSEEG